jgi:ribonuclease-3
MTERGPDLAERLSLRFENPAFLATALVHSSYINEHPKDAGESNERLEFLGDAVLSLVMSEELYRRHPDEPEGILTTRRAAIVSTQGLARIARRIDLGGAIVLGQGAEKSGERERGSVLAGTVEAVIAAIYLDKGIEAARRFILDAAAMELEAELPADGLKAPKSRLQERAFAMIGRAPVYRIVSTDGPDHDRHFVVEVDIDDRMLGRGEGRSRREAETDAATAALAALDGDGSPAAEDDAAA